MTKRELILNLLRERPRTNWELCQLAQTSDYGRRIREMRAGGYQISIEKKGPARFLYTLVAEPEPVRIAEPEPPAPVPTKNQIELL